MLPANVRLDWNVIARYKHSGLFGLVISDEQIFFIAFTPGVNVIKTFFVVTKSRSKLECLSLARLE